MKYRDFTPEKRPMGVACALAEELDLEYRTRPGDCDEAGCSGPFVDIVAGWEKKRFLMKRRAFCCAVIEPGWRTMRIYGDAHKDAMLSFAEELASRLKGCSDELAHSLLRVEFVSHEERII